MNEHDYPKHRPTEGTRGSGAEKIPSADTAEDVRFGLSGDGPHKEGLGACDSDRDGPIDDDLRRIINWWFVAEIIVPALVGGLCIALTIVCLALLI